MILEDSVIEENRRFMEVYNDCEYGFHILDNVIKTMSISDNKTINFKECKVCNYTAVVSFGKNHEVNS
jgi:hypothetical protein